MKAAISPWSGRFYTWANKDQGLYLIISKWIKSQRGGPPMQMLPKTERTKAAATSVHSQKWRREMMLMGIFGMSKKPDSLAGGWNEPEMEFIQWVSRAFAFNVQRTASHDMLRDKEHFYYFGECPPNNESTYHKILTICKGGPVLRRAWSWNKLRQDSI